MRPYFVLPFLIACALDPSSTMLPPPEAPDPLTGEMPTVQVLRVRLGEACPLPTHPAFTSVEALFPADGASLPIGLQRFCRYTCSTGCTTDPAYSVAGTDSEPDLAVIALMADLREVVGESYADAYVAAGDGIGGPLPGGAARLVTVDSAPTTFPPADATLATGASAHGQAMNQLADALLCDATGCAAELGTSLAVTLNNDGVSFLDDPVDGGTFGSFSELARGVVRTVQQWKVDGKAYPLVIALPLGWLPEYGGSASDPTTFSAPVMAAWSAILYARAEGAIVVASAGNVTGKTATSDDSGALLPAAWSTRTLLPADYLEAIGVTGPQAVPALWAAGAVDRDGGELTTNRTDARPPLVAYADHASVALAPGVYSDVMTGTSVSAVVVGAAAAAVASHRPDLDAEGTMAVLASGGPPGGPVTLCETPPCTGTSTIVDVCSAVTEACTSGSCPFLPTLPTCTSVVPGFAPDPVAAAAWAATDHVALAPVATPAASTCPDGRAAHYVGSPAADYCPDLTTPLGAAQPFVNTQPHETTCPWCYVEPGGVTYLEVNTVNTDGAGWDFYSSVTLTVKQQSGALKSLTTSSLPPQTHVTFTLPAAWGLESDPVAEAKITAVHSTGTSTGTLAVAD
jgi:hypothetical protein